MDDCAMMVRLEILFAPRVCVCELYYLRHVETARRSTDAVRVLGGTLPPERLPSPPSF